MTLDEVRYFTRELLAKYPMNSEVTEADDYEFLMELFQNHPEFRERIPGLSRPKMLVVRNRRQKATELQLIFDGPPPHPNSVGRLCGVP